MNKFAIRVAVFATAGLVVLQLAAPVLALDLKDKVGSRPGLLKAFVGRGGRVAIGSGTLKSISATSVPAILVVSGKDGKQYSVNVDANTQLRRRFGGKATLAEFAVGDTLNVIGKWADDGKTTVEAKLVRDESIQKRFGVFVGEITSLTTDGWVMNTVHRSSQTVAISSDTKLVNRKEQAIARSDLKVGDKVRVKGMWNSKLNIITEVTHVKDYSLPAKTITP